MSETLINGAPMVIHHGINDVSIPPQIDEPVTLPTHLAKVYGFAAWGPLSPELVVGASRTNTYGAISFDERGPYATHATVLSNVLNAAANQQIFERVVPADIGPKATARLWMDVLPTQVPEYERGTDGQYKRSEAGELIPTGLTIDGFKVKWLVTPVELATGVSTFGMGAQKAGTMTDADSATQSVQYPIKDVEVSHLGARGNNIGFRLWAATSLSSNPALAYLTTDEKAFGYRLAFVERADELSLPKALATLNGEQYIDVVLKPDTIDHKADMQVSLEARAPEEWQQLNEPGMPKRYGPVGRVHVYQANLEQLLTQFAQAELPYLDGFSDMDGTGEDIYRFNPVSGVSLQNAPYHSFVIERNALDAVNLTENSTIYAMGGSDGTMTEAAFATLVSDKIKEYADPDAQVQDLARNPESIFYDSGFPLQTKYDLFSFIAVRKDTAVVVSVHDVLGLPLTAAQQSSLAISLKTRAQMYPDSELYGTPVCRAMIVGRSGKMIGTKYKRRLPITLEIADKAARYMGAGNGVWRNEYYFDSAPGNKITKFTDIDVTWTPATARNKDWANGLVWVQSFDMKDYFIPAFKTVYDNDASVLNSFFTMMACVELQKVGKRAWRQLTGTSKLSNSQIVERNNRFIVENTEGRFDNRFVITPETNFTEADLRRGYSWHTKIGIKAPMMKTVSFLTVESGRLDEDIVGL